ncbi:MAG: pentapeptide repeat-containing protein [Peptostreptococcaceae bacterium]|nr:pentapeptide repeat-containing protein [Peptostreptococcaceae bacterium]
MCTAETKTLRYYFQNATLKEVTFLNSHLKYANFDMALLKNVSIIK